MNATELSHSSLQVAERFERGEAAVADRNDVLILRDLTPQEVRGGGKELRQGQRRLVAPKVEVQSSKSLRLSTLREDKTVVGMAPVIMLKAYRPEARAVASDVESNWGLDAIGVPFSPYSGAGVKVAIVDSGIDRKHPCFKGAKIKPRDFTGEGVGDSSGHGTHCAATVFGRDYKGHRIGVARGIIEALDAKVFGKSGSCSSPQLMQAVLWAAIDESATVISLSLGFDFTGMVRALHEEDHLPLELATSRALDAYRANLRLFDNLTNLIQSNTILVAAAGNESASGCKVSVSPPAIANGVISVGAAELAPAQKRSKRNALRIAEFSNTGPTLVAPGVNIVSAKPSEKKDDKELLCEMSGTSMAAPHVAGVAALWAEKLAAAKNLSTESLIAHLTTSVSRCKFQANCDPRDFGAGLVQAPNN